MSLINAKVRAAANISDATGEGHTSWMYLDTVSQVTIGFGHMMPTAAAAISIDLRDGQKQPVKPEEKKKEWQRLRDLSPAGTKLNYKAQHYMDDAILLISDDEAQRLLLNDLDGSVAALRRAYKGIEAFPEDAQVALIDMIFNLGPGNLKKFKKMNKAIKLPKGPDWTKAAELCRRPQLSKERNRLTKDLFTSAAKAAAAEASAKLGASLAPAVLAHPAQPHAVPQALVPSGMTPPSHPTLQ